MATNPWSRENFINIREPMSLTYDTPHGYLSMNHILYINDNLPGRSPFSYREKEAAVWIVEELLAMGHDWDDIQIQEFTFRDTQVLRRGITWVWMLTHPMVRDAEMRCSTQMTEEQIYNTAFMVNADVLFEGPYMIFGAGFSEMSERDAFSIWGYRGCVAEFNEITNQVYIIANELNHLHDFELHHVPEIIFASSDQLAFLHEGFTVVNLFGLYKTDDTDFREVLYLEDGRRFTTRVLHTPGDSFRIIERLWPGKIETNMRGFSIFLEEMIMMR